ncbi:MAG: zf-HC2 domain-containing protein [Actinomycetota bacterium]
MSAAPTCEEVRDLAPEVALGVAPGEERAAVLAHLRSCSDCRRVVEGMADTADALLLLAPAHEPAPGFESKVLAQLKSARPPRRARTLLAIAAAMLLAATIAGVAVFRATADDRKLADFYRHALAEAHGEYFGVVPLRSPGGERAGHLFAYEGSTSWVFVVLASPVEPGSYRAEIETRTGERIVFGSFRLDEGDITWGKDVPVPLLRVHSLRILDDRGTPILLATFPPPE